jgi:hypothetical protein
MHHPLELPDMRIDGVEVFDPVRLAAGPEEQYIAERMWGQPTI